MIPVVRPGDAHVGSSMVMLLVAIFSVVVLLLPLKEDDHSSTHLPQWLFITVNHKLFAAFTLGMFVTWDCILLICDMGCHSSGTKCFNRGFV